MCSRKRSGLIGFAWRARRSACSARAAGRPPRRPPRNSMWPWIKRWRDWVMNDLLPTYRIGAQPRALHFSFEKAGLVLHDQPIPWNAEAVLVEATLRLPSPGMRRKQDFLLALPGQEPRPADNLRKVETTAPDEHRHSVSFRIVPPAA